MNRILIGDCRVSMRELIGQGVRVHKCVTSPPYWCLRDYGVEGQLGLETTPAEYIANMVGVFALVRELLHDEGTLWLNLGDSYANDWKWGGATGGLHPKELHGTQIGRAKRDTGLKSKDMVGIPWRVALALQANGWYLRRDIIWHKKNPMPESVTDRPTTAHEYLFLLAKAEKYFYDHEAIKEPQEEGERTRRLKEQAKGLDSRYALRRDQAHGQHAPSEEGCARTARARQELALRGTRNKRSVWTLSAKPYDEAHFAVFPEELVEPCILAGTSARGHCPQCGSGWRRIMGEPLPAEGEGSWNKERKDRSEHGGVGGRTTNQAFGVPWQPSVPQTAGWEPGCKCELEPVPGIAFDPFMGSGTTAQVALALGRNYLGCELNGAYEPMQHRRTQQPGLALS